LSDISISSDGRDAPSEFNEKAAVGEAGGASTFWIANHLFLRDPVVLATRALSQTERMSVALMAVSPLTLHPVQIAMAAATLDEAFPGRVKLCLGVGAPADLKALEIDGSRPLRAMREALRIIRALLAGETVNYHGETFTVASRRLVTERRPVPLILAASGPQTLKLAGAEADGVLISAGSSVQFVEQTLKHVDEGANGRKVRTHGLVYAAVGEGESVANDRLRRILAILLRGPHHRANLDAAGSALDQAALNQAVVAEDWDRAQAMITDDIVARHAASGPPARVRERLAAYHAAGLDEVIVAGARDGDQIRKILRSFKG
jgi:5,10-methylenetetrahydromethanopterin reductase